LIMRPAYQLAPVASGTLEGFKDCKDSKDNRDDKDNRGHQAQPASLLSLQSLLSLGRAPELEPRANLLYTGAASLP